MRIRTITGLLTKLLLAMMAFPPVYILIKYLRWCGKQDGQPETQTSEEA